MESNSSKVLNDFNLLLNRCYQGKLINFCSEFDIKERGASFYKKVQKNRNRMAKQNVNVETMNEFKKYIIFMEAKLLEQECTWVEKKALNEFKSFL